MQVTNYSLALRMAAKGINAPPFGDGVAPFSWSGAWAGFSHRGLPDSMTAEFEIQEP